MLSYMSDEDLLTALRYRKETLAKRKALWGKSTLRSDQDFISEACDKVYEAEREARLRGLLVSE